MKIKNLTEEMKMTGMWRVYLKQGVDHWDDFGSSTFIVFAHSRKEAYKKASKDYDLDNIDKIVHIKNVPEKI